MKNLDKLRSLQIRLEDLGIELGRWIGEQTAKPSPVKPRKPLMKEVRTSTKNNYFIAMTKQGHLFVPGPVLEKLLPNLTEKYQGFVYYLQLSDGSFLLNVTDSSPSAVKLQRNSSNWGVTVPSRLLNPRNGQNHYYGCRNGGTGNSAIFSEYVA